MLEVISTMKKTLCVIAIMVISLSVFFCLPVNAATEGVPYIQRNISAWTANGQVYIQAYCQTMFLNYEQVVGQGTTEIQQAELQHHLFLNIFNESSQTKYIETLNYTFQIMFEDETTGENIMPSTLHIETLNLGSTNDFYIIPIQSGFFRLQAGSQWSNGRYICIPPNSSLIADVYFVTHVEASVGGSSGSVINYNYILPKQIALPSFTATVTDVEPHGSTRGIYQKLKELVDFFKGNTTTNDNITTDSGTLATQSDQVHSQEASYYQQNSQAIQATGLSNYQFDASAVSGLSGVRGDFIDIWNSLGSWNSVYIFSLTLGLALTILRHAPSAITSSIHRRNAPKQSGGKTH